MLQEVVDDWLLYLEALEESPLHDDDDDVSFDRTAYIICKQKKRTSNLFKYQWSLCTSNFATLR